MGSERLDEPANAGVLNPPGLRAVAAAQQHCYRDVPLATLLDDVRVAAHDPVGGHGQMCQGVAGERVATGDQEHQFRLKEFEGSGEGDAPTG